MWIAIFLNADVMCHIAYLYYIYKHESLYGACQHLGLVFESSVAEPLGPTFFTTLPLLPSGMKIRKYFPLKEFIKKKKIKPICRNQSASFIGRACVWNIITARHGIKVFETPCECDFFFIFLLFSLFLFCYEIYYFYLLLQTQSFSFTALTHWGWACMGGFFFFTSFIKDSFVGERFHLMMMFVNGQILHWWGVVFILFLGAKTCMLIQSTIINISACLITLMHQPLS